MKKTKFLIPLLMAIVMMAMSPQRLWALTLATRVTSASDLATALRNNEVAGMSVLLEGNTTIVLGNDITITDPQDAQFTLMSSNVTLDLNEHTLTVDAYDGEPCTLFSCFKTFDESSGDFIGAPTTLTVKNGTINIVEDYNNFYFFDMYEDCVLNLQEVTINNNARSGGNIASLEHSTLNILGGCNLNIANTNNYGIKGFGNLNFQGTSTITAEKQLAPTITKTCANGYKIVEGEGSLQVIANDNQENAGGAVPTFDSLEELIAAGQDYDAVNVTIEDEVLRAMSMEGRYIVGLKNSEITLFAPGSDLGWASGGTVTGTLTNVAWNNTNKRLSGKDADFWSDLTYTASSADNVPTFASIDELLAANLESGTTVTVTINGTIAEAMYIPASSAYMVKLDNGFVLAGMFCVTSDPEWEVGGTVSGTLENVPFLNEDGELGIMSMGRNIFDDLDYNEPGSGPDVASVTINGEETKYSNIEDALTAVQESTTSSLKLLADVESPLTLISHEGQDITIDLNGHTYTANLAEEDESNWGLINLYDDSQLTVKNGTFNSNKFGFSGFDNSTLNLINCTVETKYEAIYTSSNAVVTIEDTNASSAENSAIYMDSGTVNISGSCSFIYTGENDYAPIFVYEDQDGVLNIADGYKMIDHNGTTITSFKSRIGMPREYVYVVKDNANDGAVPIFSSLDELIAADQDYDAVNVTIEDEVFQAVFIEGHYAVRLKNSGVVLRAPGSDLGWSVGGTVTGTLSFAGWNNTDKRLSGEEAAFWSDLTCSDPDPSTVNTPTFASIDELLDADIENGTTVTVTIKGTIAETMYRSEMSAYSVILDNGFGLASVNCVTSNPEWKVGGTLSGTLENVILMRNSVEGEELVGVMSMTTNIFAPGAGLEYNDPAGGDGDGDDSGAPTQPAEGDGSRNNPFLIGTAQELVWFAQYVNGESGDESLHADACAKLTADIDLSSVCGEGVGNWTPIAELGKYTWENSYSGEFDGNGKTISNLYFNDSEYDGFGFIGMALNGYIHDINFAYANITARISCGIACNYGGTIENIEVLSGQISGMSYIAGIAANSDGIRNCTNYANVNANTIAAAGIVSSGYTYIEGCTNYGNITSSGYPVAGICSYAAGLPSILNCANYGTIKCTSTEGEQGGIGAIIGYPWFATVANCVNFGDIYVLEAEKAGYIAGTGKLNNVTNILVNTGKLYVNNVEQEGAMLASNMEWADGGSNTSTESTPTSEQLASGEIAFVLQQNCTSAMWGQNIGTDATPVIGGLPVYIEGEPCTGTPSAPFTYTNDRSYFHGTFTHHEAVTATCTQTGAIEYWECDDCHAKFSDSEHLNSVDDIVIPTTEHNYENGTCIYCGASYPTLAEGNNTGINIAAVTGGGAYNDPSHYNIFRIVAPGTGTMTVTTKGNEDTYGYLFDEDFNPIKGDDDGGDDMNFLIEQVVEAGEIYYIGVREYDGNAIENYTIYLTGTWPMENIPSMTIVDGTEYDGADEGRIVTELTYQRNVSESQVGKWQAYYVPFQMPIAKLNEAGFDVACINNFHEYTDEDGNVLNRELEVRMLKNGTLRGNWPYLIRPKTAGEKNIVLENAKLADANTMDWSAYAYCSSVNTEYYFYGTYQPMNELLTREYMFLSGGTLCTATNDEQVLKPQRWYLYIDEFDNQLADDDSYLNSGALAKQMNIVVIGEGNATGIEDIRVITSVLDAKSINGIFDIQGRKLSAPVKGINIMRQNDGSVRKVMVK